MTLAAPLGDLLGEAGVGARLVAAGHSRAHDPALHRNVVACAEALSRLAVSASTLSCAFVVPGRIEVLGKHTDYGGGRSLLAAVERSIVVVATPRADRVAHVVDVASGASIRLAIDPSLPPQSGWANYATAVVRRIARNFPSARTGADIAFMSDLPAAAGMSSSSALVVSLFFALATINRLVEDDRYQTAIQSPEDLSGYLAAIENGADFDGLSGDSGVGTHGGSEDHTAMLCSRPDALVQYAFAPVRLERVVPMPGSHHFVIAVSGVRAQKTGAVRERYNRAAELLRVTAELWRAATGRTDATVGAAIDADPNAAESLRQIISASRDGRFTSVALMARVEQFLAESCEVVPAAGDALVRGDVAAFGLLVDRSQDLADRLLGNQIAETTHLARSARAAGAAAASAFGAGFGGSVWALIDDRSADRFLRDWQTDYIAQFPERRSTALFFQTRAGSPVVRVV